MKPLIVVEMHLLLGPHPLLVPTISAAFNQSHEVYIMPLLIYAFWGIHTHTRTHTNAHTHTHTQYLHSV